MDRRKRSEPPVALSHLRICDFTGQLAGAGATRYLAAFGAEVIRIEDPARQGQWDILRGAPPFVDGRRGVELGGGFNNHNVEKLGVTIDLRQERGRDLVCRLIQISDVVAENFSAGVLANLGLTYSSMEALRPDIIYVSNSGFGHEGPYATYRSWGPIVQAVSGLTFAAGLPGLGPAGWGYSYMDHHGANYMALAILSALLYRDRTGEGQWIDMSCTQAAATLNGPVVLDWSVNGRPLRRAGMPDSNRSTSPPMVPHGIYPTLEEDRWIAVACRDDRDWAGLSSVISVPERSGEKLASLSARLECQEEVDNIVKRWTARKTRAEIVERLRTVGVPVASVALPGERIDDDPDTAAWGLWPEVDHREIGKVRVDGLPVHLSETDWSIQNGAPCLGADNDFVFGELLGIPEEERRSLKVEGVI